MRTQVWLACAGSARARGRMGWESDWPGVVTGVGIGVRVEGDLAGPAILRDPALLIEEDAFQTELAREL